MRTLVNSISPLLSLLPLVCGSMEIKSEIPNMKRAYALVLGGRKEKVLSCVQPGLPEKMEIRVGGWPRQREGRQRRMWACSSEEGRAMMQLWPEAGGPGHGGKKCSVGGASFTDCDFAWFTLCCCNLEILNF